MKTWSFINLHGKTQAILHIKICDENYLIAGIGSLYPGAFDRGVGRSGRNYFVSDFEKVRVERISCNEKNLDIHSHEVLQAALIFSFQFRSEFFRNVTEGSDVNFWNPFYSCENKYKIIFKYIFLSFRKSVIHFIFDKEPMDWACFPLFNVKLKRLYHLKNVRTLQRQSLITKNWKKNL